MNAEHGHVNAEQVATSLGYSPPVGGAFCLSSHRCVILTASTVTCVIVGCHHGPMLYIYLYLYIYIYIYTQVHAVTAQF